MTSPERKRRGLAELLSCSFPYNKSGIGLGTLNASLKWSTQFMLYILILLEPYDRLLLVPGLKKKKKSSLEILLKCEQLGHSAVNNSRETS